MLPCSASHKLQDLIWKTFKICSDYHQSLLQIVITRSTRKVFKNNAPNSFSNLAQKPKTRLCYSFKKAHKNDDHYWNIMPKTTDIILLSKQFQRRELHKPLSKVLGLQSEFHESELTNLQYNSASPTSDPSSKVASTGGCLSCYSSKMRSFTGSCS